MKVNTYKSEHTSCFQTPRFQTCFTPKFDFFECGCVGLLYDACMTREKSMDTLSKQHSSVSSGQLWMHCLLLMLMQHNGSTPRHQLLRQEALSAWRLMLGVASRDRKTNAILIARNWADTYESTY